VRNSALVGEWPGDPAVVLFRLDDRSVTRVEEAGDVSDVRPWASVSKMAVALAFGVEIDRGEHRFDETFGPGEATLAHLLSHSSGAGLEENDRRVDLGTKRVYSNFGFNHAVDVAARGQEPATWLEEQVFAPLALSSTRLDGRPCADVFGSTNDMCTLAVAWLSPEIITEETRNRQIEPYLPELSGIVPGFGRFTTCPWGLGPELRGTKEHWMGEWPAESFGHFGQSGSMMLLNVKERIGLVATSTEPFGGWAVKLWPTWTSHMRERLLNT
jgi:CubicO group peptidase (beta-lactamase class C family)